MIVTSANRHGASAGCPRSELSEGLISIDLPQFISQKHIEVTPGEYGTGHSSRFWWHRSKWLRMERHRLIPPPSFRAKSLSFLKPLSALNPSAYIRQRDQCW